MILWDVLHVNGRLANQKMSIERYFVNVFEYIFRDRRPFHLLFCHLFYSHANYSPITSRSMSSHRHQERRYGSDTPHIGTYRTRADTRPVRPCPRWLSWFSLIGWIYYIFYKYLNTIEYCCIIYYRVYKRIHTFKRCHGRGAPLGDGNPVVGASCKSFEWFELITMWITLLKIHSFTTSSIRCNR